MSSQKTHWPVPTVVECLDEGLGTVARPLTAELYLCPDSLRHLPPRASRAKAWASEPKKASPCSCFASLAVAWLLVFATAGAFCAGMYAESRYLRHFKRRRAAEEAELGTGCPGGQWAFEAAEVGQYRHWEGEAAVAAETATACRDVCAANAHCLRADFHPAQRDCHLWHRPECVQPQLRRDNSLELVARDCQGANCTTFTRLCTACDEPVPLQRFAHLNACLRIRDYEDVVQSVC